MEEMKIPLVTSGGTRSELIEEEEEEEEGGRENENKNNENENENENNQVFDTKNKSWSIWQYRPVFFIIECIRDHPHLSTCIVWTLVVFLVAEIGGIIFSYCEYWYEKNQIELKQELYANISSSLNATVHGQLDTLLSLSSVPNDNKDNRWRIRPAAFFAFSTATTIGYGFTAPKTIAGRLFVFLYGLPAIIFYGLAFYNIGKVIAAFTDRGLRAQDSKRQSFRIIRERCSFEARRILMLFGIISIFLLFGALCLHSKEGWSIGIGLYFMWVSITTIGYGDIQPSSTIAQAPEVANIFIYIGLSLVAVFIGCCQEWFKDNYIKRWHTKIHLSIGSDHHNHKHCSENARSPEVSGGHPIFLQRGDTDDTGIQEEQHSLN